MNRDLPLTLMFMGRGRAIPMLLTNSRDETWLMAAVPLLRAADSK